ncbi:MAG: tyrosine-type recombinase/integrase [Massilia sp.]
MVALRLTATKIDRYKPPKDDEILTDGNGLSIRFRRGKDGSTSKTWLYVYKDGKKSVYLTLGEHNYALPDFDCTLYRLPPGARLTLETARRAAAEIADWRKRGVDPKQHIQAERDRSVAQTLTVAKTESRLQAKLDQERLTVRDLFDIWITDGVRRKDGNSQLKRLFEADVLPHVGGIELTLLTEHDLRAVLRSQVARGVNRTAVITRNSLRQMFTWARKRQPWRKLLVDGDPMDLIEIEKIVSPGYDLNNESDRVLSASEIIELWNILRQSEHDYALTPNKRLAPQPLNKKTRYAIWIMLSTLCRVGEMTMAKWEHVDFSRKEWFIPKSNVKKNVAHLLVFLSPFALSQFQELYKLTGHSDWCFPSRDQKEHMDLKSITKQIGDRQSIFKQERKKAKSIRKRQQDNTLVLAGGRHGSWSPHDLRRTGATMMQALGVPLDTIDRCQNHVIFGSKVRRHYLRHDYATEKREAWLKLGLELMRVLGIANDEN